MTSSLSLTAAALRNPHAVAVLCLFIIVVGAVSAQRIPVDLLPAYRTPAVQILTLYPGMPAEIVERDITNRLERWTSQAEGIARQESRSMIGVSIVKDFFRDDIDPNTAMSQVAALAISDLYYLPPGTIPPMVMLFDPTATLPTCLLACSSETLDETEVYDLSYFNVRNLLSGTPGVIAPAVFGGRLRRIYVYVDRDRLEARGLSLMEVQRALKSYNLMIPTGNAKIGEFDYSINAESMVPRIADFNQIVVKSELTPGGSVMPVLVKDIGETRDTYAIQTNAVRISSADTGWKSRRQVYIPIFRRPGANTIQVVEGIKQRIPEFLSRLPKQGLKLNVVNDQSIYVRQAIGALVKEGALGAALAALMILVFLGSLRSTVAILFSIPLSILAAVAGLHFTGHSLNAMTLGGLALVLGRLVDDAIVVLENTERHLHLGKPPRQAAHDGALEVASPVFISTVTTVAVFAPVVFLYGMGKYLFTPLALSVTFAMFASYVLAMTLVPAYCARFLRSRFASEGEVPVVSSDPPAATAGGDSAGASPSLAARIFVPIQATYARLLAAALRRRNLFLALVAALFAGSLLLYPHIGKELFPQVDAGQFRILVRAASGTRLERTEALTQRIEEVVKQEIPESDREMVVTNLGVLYDWPAGYTPNAGPMDAFLLVQLTSEGRRVTAQQYAARLRPRLRREFPEVEFAFDTGGMISAALNFGAPAPLNLQVEGRDLKTQYALAQEVRDLVAGVPGAVDVRIQEKIDYPQIDLEVDRIRSAYLGITQEDIVKNVVSATNSSTGFEPTFWLDFVTGNHYFVGVTYPEAMINSLDTLRDVPITGARQPQPIRLRNLARFKQSQAAVEVSHLNITRIVNILAGVEGRDVAAVAGEIERRLGSWGTKTGRRGESVAWQARGRSGYTVRLRGEVQSMTESFVSLAFGFVLAALLIYLLMVAQLKSFLDPFIIMFAVPLGLIGVLATLWLTHTTLNVQSFMGVIFMVGIAVSNSILLVEFANRLRGERELNVRAAAVEAARVRLRPILMTSLAAVLALFPMALHDGEASMPLARAVIGGLTVSTLLTLFVVPLLYTMFKREAVPSR